MTDHPVSVEAAKAFEGWWARNHPFDWYTKERGTPMDTADRLRVWHMARQAFHAAWRASAERESGL